MTEEKPVLVGRMTKPHGVRGEIKLRLAEGSSGAWRSARHARLGGDRNWRKIESVRGSGGLVLVKLEGIDTPEEARSFCGRDFFVPRSELAPPESGSYYLADLVGLQVVDRRGNSLGRMEDSFFNGAHEVFVVRDGKRTWLLPAVESMILEIDPEKERLLVEVPEGLVDL